MKNTSRKKDIIQLVIKILFIVVLGFLSGITYFRLDLTSDKRYTLSPVSRNILEKVDDVVYVEVFLDGDYLPIGFKKMRKATADLLEELRVIAGSNLEFTFINPYKEDDPETQSEYHMELIKRGLQPTEVIDEDEEGGISRKLIFPGALIKYKGRELAVHLLKNKQGLSAEQNLNNSIQGLEYEIINAIDRLADDQVQKIAFIEGHGELDGYQVEDITNELAKYYEVYRGYIDLEVYNLQEYEAVIVAKPVRKWKEEEKYVLDQYIMHGGKVLWFIDQVNVNSDSLSTGANTIALINDLNLDDMLFTYGIRINPLVIQDIQCSLIPVNIAGMGQEPRFAPAPWYYYPLLDPPDHHPITKNLNLVRSEFANVVDTVGQNPHVKKTVLLHSSAYTRLRKAPFMISLEQVKEAPDKGDFSHSFQPVGILLEGRFPSVFQNRVLKGYKNTGDFKSQSEPTQIMVVADGDIIRNEVLSRGGAPQPMPLGYDRYTRKTYGNKEFIVNAVNYITGKRDLMQLRTREFRLRLLDKTKVTGERVMWQLINIFLPVLWVVFFGIWVNIIRKKRFT